MLFSRLPLWAITFGAGIANGIDLNPDDIDSIKSSASTVAAGMMSHYTGYRPGDNPGNLPPPYYWWEAGAMFGHLVEYWYYTGDDQYNAHTQQAITWQAGTDAEFMPPNQTLSEGNDDQIFWAFAAMSAAELNFPAPEGNGPSYLTMAIAVYNLQSARWDNKTCGGGLRWQILSQNTGWDYKNAVANGGLFQLSARLARYTGEDKYANWAEKHWDWFSTSVLYEPSTHQINDGTDVTANCTKSNPTQWSYNYGLWFTGLAYMYSATQDQKWLTELKAILNTYFTNFYPQASGGKILVEIVCEPSGNCDTDNLCFKSFSMRWLALTAQLVPELADQINPYLRASGKAAAGQCSGGSDGNTCGMKWTQTAWDGSTGVGQQMSALAAIDANMLRLKKLNLPYTAKTGGTSKGDPSAGTETGPGNNIIDLIYTRKITTADQAGAGILTAMALAFTLGGGYWILGTSA
ncbi:glycoside hydrolase family 76 protein [Acrodontium crateriforme]|uniref:Mannan endo-1,6-alpha-mannosidase n=1 Tax=Acrodontium crateriforme TaxID=150365 RepID=A0AAQ3M4M0_9PEZI|nr:glycoside hydrolase family 76 protein [Acrodontium crateriforme]